jgi:hypothetical protein
MKRLAAYTLLATFAVAHGEEVNSPRTEILEQTPGGPVVKFTLGDFTTTRTLHDSDGEGWCDLWCVIFKDIEHRNKTTDTDGDGLTDYQEMVLMRDP